MTRRKRRVFLEKGNISCLASRSSSERRLSSPPLGLSIAAEAETVAAGSPNAHKVPMHRSTLTLRSGAHGRPHGRHHNCVHDTFRQPTPIHGTMAGPRM